MLAYKPGISLEEIALYFELLSGGDDRITVVQFLSLGGMLNFKFVHRGDEEPEALVAPDADTADDDDGPGPVAAKGKSKEKKKKAGVDLSYAAWAKWLTRGLAGVSSQVFCMEFVNLVDLILLMSDYHDINLGGVLVYALSLEHTKVGAAVIQCCRLFTPCLLISAVYILEWALVAAAHSAQVSFGQHVVEKVPLFKVLSSTDKRSMLSHMTVIDFPAGSYICKQGAPGNMFYIITEGRCKVTLDLPDNKEKLLVEFHAGQSFGEIALLDALGRRTANVVALTPVCCMALNRDDFNATFKHLRVQLVEYQKVQSQNAEAEKKEKLKQQEEEKLKEEREKEKKAAGGTEGRKSKPGDNQDNPPAAPAPAPPKKAEEPRSVKLAIVPDRYQSVFREHCRVVHRLKYPGIQRAVLLATFAGGAAAAVPAVRPGWRWGWQWAG